MVCYMIECIMDARIGWLNGKADLPLLTLDIAYAIDMGRIVV